MDWTAVDIGNYRGTGKILPQVVFDDPDWFFWAYQEGVFKGALAAEAEHVYWRARRIRVPPRDGLARVAEYTTSSRTGKFIGLALVWADSPRHSPTSSDRLPWIDLAYPRNQRGYDKAGGQLILRAAKYHLFGFESARMTRERAAAFFEGDANFELS